MFHPFFCYLGVALTFLLTYFIFGYTQLDLDKYFYVPIVLLIGHYTLVAVLQDRKVYAKRNTMQALLKAAGKYMFWGLMVYGLWGFYTLHPLYREMTPHTRDLVKHFLYAFAAFGLPYFFLEEKFRHCTDNVVADPYVRLVILFQHLGKEDFWRRLFSSRNRRTLLSWMIRIHYIPIMVEQVHAGLIKLSGYWGYYQTRKDVDGFPMFEAVCFMIMTAAWMIDSNNASVGYFWQSSFTKTRFRDADPHPSHWILVLACYVPFIDFVSYNFVPFPALAEDSARIFSHPALNTAIDLGMLTALVCYMLSGCTLAFSYSNLCYKRIQTKGPYGLIRHPATACKLMFFTLAFFRFQDAFDVRWGLCYVIWISVYIGRALVEERFLRRFPEYRDYMKKTRYRFFPGIA